MALGIGSIGGIGGGLDLQLLEKAKSAAAAGIGGIGGLGGTSAGGPAMEGFGDVLAGKIDALNASQADSATAMQDMATGSVDDVAQTMMRIEEASVQLQFATQLRNKGLEAYQEILRMQI